MSKKRTQRPVDYVSDDRLLTSTKVVSAVHSMLRAMEGLSPTGRVEAMRLLAVSLRPPDRYPR